MGGKLHEKEGTCVYVNVLLVEQVAWCTVKQRPEANVNSVNP